MTHYEMAEKLSERMGVTLEEATAALEACEWEMLDAALLPINGRDGVRYRNNLIGNMTFQEAADLAGEVKAGTVIPGHWDMFAENLGDPEAFADYFGAKYPGQARVVKPRYMEPMEISDRV